MTASDFRKYIEDAVEVADVALPLVGEADLVPIVMAAAALVQKIAAVAQQRSGDATIAASMAAARLAADVLERQKFGAAK